MSPISIVPITVGSGCRLLPCRRYYLAIRTVFFDITGADTSALE